MAAIAGVTAAVLVSAFALLQWDASFNPPYRDRVAAVGSIPPGPFLAIDAAAWRWIADRPVVVTPSNGIPASICAAATYGTSYIVLEPVHFSAYSALDELARPIASAGTIQVFRIGDLATKCDR